MTDQTVSLNECRRDFEAYCKDIDCYAGRHHKIPDQYQLYETQLRWMGWQAAWELREKKIEDMENAMTPMSDSLGVLANE